MSYQDNFDDPRRGVLHTFLANLGGRFAAGALLLAAAGLGIVLWSAYPDSDPELETANVPIVRADIRPYKAAPEDPGGIDIPHRDSTVFATLRTGRPGQEGGLENLLDDTPEEDPVPRSQLFAGLNADQPEQKILETPEIQDTVLNPDFSTTKQPESAPVANIQPETPLEPNEPEEKAGQTVAKIEPAAGAAHTAKTVEQGAYYIQLGSVRTETGAHGEWKKIQTRYARQLGPIDYRVRRADLGDKGTFYRIQAGPVPKNKAVSICDAIKKQTPGGCLVTGK